LPNWVLRDFCAWLAGPICSIFNASVRESFIPGRWKEANVPVPKVHPPRSIESDLRPISLTATLGKLSESFVGLWILERTECKLNDRSTTHPLVDVLHHWHHAVNTGQFVQTVFVDFAKAFEHVDHKILIFKLRECAFLINRRQRVKIDKTLSEWMSVGAGMRQGSYLGLLTLSY